MRLFLLLMLFAFEAGASLKVKVLDENGKAVVDAVVAVSDLNPSANPTNLDSLPIAIMDQINMEFRPHVLVVNHKQFVRFPNSDDTRHHVYSFSKPKVFELKLFKGTQTEAVEMDTAGIVELGCNIHDQMLGYIYVDETGSAVKTNQSGVVNLSVNTPANVTLWHPRLDHAKGELLQFSIDELDAEGFANIRVSLKPDLKKESNTFKRRFQSADSN